jgi:hypothetical protein
MIGHDNAVDAGLRRFFRVIGVENAFEQ